MLSAFASLVILAVFAAAGIAVVGRVFRFTTELERVAFGSVVGIAGSTLALVPAAGLFGFSATIVTAVAGLALAIAFVFGWPLIRPWVHDRRPIAPLVRRLDPIATVVIGLITLRWAFLWKDALVVRADGLYAGHEYIWSDWPTHIAIVTRFASGSGFPPQNVHVAGMPSAYHYLSDLTPAAFVTLGMDPFAALSLHSFVLSVLAALAIWAFARRLTGRRAAATLAMVIFLFGAGLGWVAHVATVDSGQGILAGLIADPWDPKSQVAAHVRVFNPYLAFLMSQRAYLYGLPIAMFVLVAVRMAAARRSVGLFVATGVIAGLLPLAHLPTLLAMAIVLPVLALLLLSRPWRLRELPLTGWLAFGVTWVVVSMPQLLSQLGGGSGALAAMRLQLGWVATEGQFGDSWISFWVKNVGLLGILCLVAVAVGLLERHAPPRARLMSPHGLRIALALQVLFVVVNTIVFQPWDWDDHKILVYWMLSASVLVAALVVAIWRRIRRWPALGRVVVGIGLAGAVASIVAGPVLENAWMLGGGGRYRMLTTAQIELAEAVRDATPADGVIVTGMTSHDPVQMLSGRQVLMGYWGQLWVSGIPHLQREAEVLSILRLAPDAKELIDRFGVAAVVIGPDERDRLEADVDGFRERYPVIVDLPGYEVFGTR